MTAQIIPLGCITKLNQNPDLVLEWAKGQFAGGVVLIGFDENGDLSFYSSIADGGSVMWALEMAKKALLEVEV